MEYNGMDSDEGKGMSGHFTVIGIDEKSSWKGHRYLTPEYYNFTFSAGTFYVNQTLEFIYFYP